MKITEVDFDKNKEYEAVHVIDHVGRTFDIAEEFYIAKNDKDVYVKISKSKVEKKIMTEAELAHELRAAVPVVLTTERKG